MRSSASRYQTIRSIEPSRTSASHTSAPGRERTSRMARRSKHLKTYGPPRCKWFLRVRHDRSASTYPASDQARPRWRYARSGPHKTSRRRPPFFKPGFQNAVRLSGHLASTARKRRQLFSRLRCADRPMTKPSRSLPWRQTFCRFAARPSRCAPAYSQALRPRHSDGRG
jgi:hypothetical protein